MIRIALILAALSIAAPASAQDEQAISCKHQADVVAAIQQARLDRVAERNVSEHILAQDPSWPEKFNNSIPLIAPWVYEQRRRDLRNNDLSAIWNELCLTLPTDAVSQ